MYISKDQNRILHMLLTQTGMMHNKAILVNCASNGRTESSRSLTVDEAQYLISYLRSLPNKEADQANRMRRKIISMAHEMGWHVLVGDRWVADLTRINNWMMKSSYLKKRLNDYKYNELPKLVTQFEAVYKSFLKKV